MVQNVNCRSRAAGGGSRNRRKVTHLVWGGQPTDTPRLDYRHWHRSVVVGAGRGEEVASSTSLRPIGLKRMLRNKICKFAISLRSGKMETRRTGSGSSRKVCWRNMIGGRRKDQRPVKRMRRWLELHRINGRDVLASCCIQAYLLRHVLYIGIHKISDKGCELQSQENWVQFPS